jgi:hypothetical protein
MNRKTLLDLDIDLADIDISITPYRTYLDDLLLQHRKPKNVDIMTFSINENGLASLNKLSETCELRVIYGLPWQGIPKIKRFIFIKGCHAKMCRIDEKIYFGSSNLTGNSIGNIMVEASKKQAKALRAVFDFVWATKKFPSTVIL